MVLSTTDFSRNLKKILDLIEYKGIEVVLTRNNHKIARISPGSPHLTALEAMADLYRTIPDDAAVDWVAESRITGSLSEVRDPWE